MCGSEVAFSPVPLSPVWNIMGWGFFVFCFKGVTQVSTRRWGLVRTPRHTHSHTCTIWWNSPIRDERRVREWNRQERRAAFQFQFYTKEIPFSTKKENGNLLCVKLKLKGSSIFIAPPFYFFCSYQTAAAWPQSDRMSHSNGRCATSWFCAVLQCVSAHFSALIFRFEPRHILAPLWKKKKQFSSAPAPLTFSLQNAKVAGLMYCILFFRFFPDLPLVMQQRCITNVRQQVTLLWAYLRTSCVHSWIYWI